MKTRNHRREIRNGYLLNVYLGQIESDYATGSIFAPAPGTWEWYVEIDGQDLTTTVYELPETPAPSRADQDTAVARARAYVDSLPPRADV
jgi:hypothetical protein